MSSLHLRIGLLLRSLRASRPLHDASMPHVLQEGVGVAEADPPPAASTATPRNESPFQCVITSAWCRRLAEQNRLDTQQLEEASHYTERFRSLSPHSQEHLLLHLAARTLLCRGEELARIRSHGRTRIISWRARCVGPSFRRRTASFPRKNRSPFQPPPSPKPLYKPKEKNAKSDLRLPLLGF